MNTSTLSTQQHTASRNWLEVMLPLIVLLTLVSAMLFGNDNWQFSYTLMANSTIPLKFSIGIDHLSRLMTLYILFISTVIYRFAYTYLRSERRRPVFLIQFIMVVISAMLLALAQNLLTTFIAWQFMGITLYVLLNYYHYDADANRSAKKKFVINRIGDFTFLTAIVIALFTQHTTVFASLTTNQHGLLISALLFISLLTKCAQFPFHIWLLDTMEAPTPVSALMHAGIINSGGILLTRISHLLTKSHSLLIIMIALSLLSIALTSTWKNRQADVKKQLAYSTSSQMGYMIMQCSLATFPAAILHLITHGFFKASLFLNSGQAFFERSPTTTAPLKKNRPLSLALTLVAAIICYGLLHALQLPLPAIILIFIFITLYTAISSVASQPITTGSKTLLFIGLMAMLATYLCALKGLSLYLHNYEFSANTIATPYQLIIAALFGGLWLWLSKTKIATSLWFDQSETLLRRYILNPTRAIGEKLANAFEHHGVFAVTVIAVASALVYGIFIDYTSIGAHPWVDNALILILLLLNLGHMLAANRAHNLQQLIAMLLLYQLAFIAYALLHHDSFIEKIAIYHAINQVLVMALLVRLANKRGFNHKHYLTTALLLLIGIPGSASFISEFYLLGAMYQMGYVFVFLYLAGLLLVSISIMHALQIYSFGNNKTVVSDRSASRITDTLFFTTLVINIGFGLWPNALLSWL